MVNDNRFVKNKKNYLFFHYDNCICIVLENNFLNDEYFIIYYKLICYNNLYDNLYYLCFVVCGNHFITNKKNLHQKIFETIFLRKKSIKF